MIVCVAGNPAIDKLFEVDAVRPGEIHRPDTFIPLPGGKGIHVAQVATALGADAIATGILGGHHGRWLAETLADEGVPGRLCLGAGRRDALLPHRRRPGDRGPHRVLRGRHPGHAARTGPGSPGIVDELLAQGPSWLAMAGSVPAAEDLPGLRAARQGGTRGRRAQRRGLAGPDLVRRDRRGPGSRQDQRLRGWELLGASPCMSISIALEAARTIRARAGGDGHAVDRHARRAGHGHGGTRRRGLAWRRGAHGDYPVGSGDAFLAGLLTALAED